MKTRKKKSQKEKKKDYKKKIKDEKKEKVSIFLSLSFTLLNSFFLKLLPPIFTDPSFFFFFLFKSSLFVLHRVIPNKRIVVVIDKQRKICLFVNKTIFSKTQKK